MANLKLVKKVTLSAVELISLANDLAKQARKKKDVLADYGMAEEEFYELEQNPFFMRALDEATRVWNAPMNTKARVELGALTYTETLLPHLMKRALDEKQPLNACVDAARLLAKIGGVDTKEQSQNESAERFVIQINMGSDKTTTYDKSIEKIPETPALPAN